MKKKEAKWVSLVRHILYQTGVAYHAHELVKEN
jgi:hypothetical protein